MLTRGQNACKGPGNEGDAGTSGDIMSCVYHDVLVMGEDTPNNTVIMCNRRRGASVL